MILNFTIFVNISNHSFLCVRCGDIDRAVQPFVSDIFNNFRTSEREYKSQSEFKRYFSTMGTKYKFIPIITIMLFLINVIQLISINSDTGNKSTAYLFGQLNTIGCVLLGSIVYYRYHQIKRLICQHSDLLELTHLNRKAGLLGCLMCLLYGIVAAALQEYHYFINSVGILVLFGVCAMYSVWQCDISFRIQSYIGSMELTCCRMNLALSSKWMLILLFWTQLVWVILVYRNDHDWHAWTKMFGLFAHIEKVMFVIVFAIYISTFGDIFEVEKFKIGSTQTV